MADVGAGADAGVGAGAARAQLPGLAGVRAVCGRGCRSGRGGGCRSGRGRGCRVWRGCRSGRGCRVWLPVAGRMPVRGSDTGAATQTPVRRRISVAGRMSVRRRMPVAGRMSVRGQTLVRPVRGRMSVRGQNSVPDQTPCRVRRRWGVGAGAGRNRRGSDAGGGVRNWSGHSRRRCGVGCRCRVSRRCRVRNRCHIRHRCQVKHRAESDTDATSNTDANQTPMSHRKSVPSEIAGGSDTGATTFGIATTGSESFFSSLVSVPSGSCVGFFASREGCWPVCGPEPSVLVTRRTATESESFFSSLVSVPSGSCVGLFASGEGCWPVCRARARRARYAPNLLPLSVSNVADRAACRSTDSVVKRWCRRRRAQQNCWNRHRQRRPRPKHHPSAGPPRACKHPQQSADATEPRSAPSQGTATSPTFATFWHSPTIGYRAMQTKSARNGQ